MHSPDNIQYAMETTRVLLEPDRRIDTFGDTRFEFQLLSELMDRAGEVRVRTGEVEAMRQVSVGTTASRAVLGCMNDAVVQLQAYPRGRRGELPSLVDLELHLAENVYSLTEHQTPWIRTLELFGVQGTARVRRVPQGWLH